MKNDRFYCHTIKVDAIIVNKMYLCVSMQTWILQRYYSLNIMRYQEGLPGSDEGENHV
jgi:hypothetical protein